MRYLLLFAAFTGILNAQKHSIGIEAGPSVSTAFAKPVFGTGWDDEYIPKLSFYSGLSYAYQFSKHIGIKGNLGFEMKGYNLFIYGTDTGGVKYRLSQGPFNFDYIIFSPQVRFKFGNKIEFTVDIGPYIGGLVNIPSHPSRIDFGVEVSPGIKFNVGQKFAIAILCKNSIGFISGRGAGPNGSFYPTNNFSSCFNLGLYYRL